MKVQKIAYYVIGCSIVYIAGYFIYKIETAKPVFISTTKYQNVERVFFHEPGHYSVLIPIKKDKELLQMDMGFSTYRIFEDVPQDEQMWASVDEYKILGRFNYSTNIHIHSAKDINGAGWNHGKIGSGNTIGVE